MQEDQVILANFKEEATDCAIETGRYNDLGIGFNVILCFENAGNGNLV